MTLNKVEKKLIEYFENYFKLNEECVGLFLLSGDRKFMHFYSFNYWEEFGNNLLEDPSHYYRNFYANWKNQDKNIKIVKNIPMESFYFSAFLVTLSYFYENISFVNSKTGEKVYCVLSKSRKQIAILDNSFFENMIPFPGMIEYLKKFPKEGNSLEESYLYLKAIVLNQTLDFATESIDELNENEEKIFSLLDDLVVELGEKTKAIIIWQKGKPFLLIFKDPDGKIFNESNEINKMDCEDFLDLLYIKRIASVEIFSLEGVDVEALLKSLILEDYKCYPHYCSAGKERKIHFNMEECSISFRRFYDTYITFKEEELQENMGIKKPDLRELYLDFKKNPRPKMKVIHLN